MGPPHARDLGLARCRGYTFARGVDLHGDEINLPRRFFFVYVVVVVLSSGVLWELFEFLLDAVAGLAAGYSSTPTSSGGAAGSGADSGG